MNETHTDAERELLSLLASSDNDGKAFILNSLICAVRLGDAFFNEIEPYLSRGDADGIINTVKRMVQG